ncbi:MAG: SDR family oxidoreductase [Gemmatimonadetes bacterium]|nr:SDR family oxidoreductase [Gemmatimonadota bacterium]MXY82439.1 SDR family oxidoreductase [Gemmatimonadota bacterium]MYB69868.1 SDR family oxidoreductase [Gemmatimonadota bacterium]
MSHPLFDLSNRVALVSGAASGLGKAMATGFAEAGADLVLADINADGLATAAREMEALGRRVLPVTCDVSQPDQIRTMFELIDAEYGRIDIVGNVAGNARRNTPLDLTPEEVEFTLQNLVVGRLVCCQEAGRRMMASGHGGSIINLVSIAGINALGRSHLSYSMGMGAAAQMTRELSTEWAAKGVRVNAIVCAQLMNADLKERIAADPGLGETYLRGLPMGHLGDSNDIKGAAIFLASDASAWITGAMLPLDGGNLSKNAGGSHPGMPNAPAEQIGL